MDLIHTECKWDLVVYFYNSITKEGDVEGLKVQRSSLVIW